MDRKIRFGSTGGHSALPIVYGLKASSLLFCWFALVCCKGRFEGGMDGGQERLVFRVRCFLERRARDEDRGANLVLTILLIRY